jgi:hypothetical protein
MNACRATGEQCVWAVVWRKHSAKDDPKCQKDLPHFCARYQQSHPSDHSVAISHKLVARKAKDGVWMRRKMKGCQGGKAAWIGILNVLPTLAAFHFTSRHPSD